MDLALLAGPLGALFRLIPEAFKLWDASNARKHEKEMFELNLKADELRGQREYQAMELRGTHAEAQAEWAAISDAIQAQGKMTGWKWVDGINQMMRPFLTFWHCIAMYTAFKIVSYLMLVSAGTPALQAMAALYTDVDEAIVLSILSFWFVDRSLRKMGRG